MLSALLAPVLAAALVVAGADRPAPPPGRFPLTAGCTSGEFRWTSMDGPMTMTRRALTFHSVGYLRDCVGVPGIGWGRFTGTHIAMSDCTHPANGPLFVTVTWSNGQVSKLAGNWPVALAQPTDGFLTVVDGLGKGLRMRVVVDYDVMSPQNMAACLGSGLTTSTGHVLRVTPA